MPKGENWFYVRCRIPEDDRPDQFLLVAADALEEHGFSDLAEDFRDEARKVENNMLALKSRAFAWSASSTGTEHLYQLPEHGHPQLFPDDQPPIDGEPFFALCGNTVVYHNTVGTKRCKTCTANRDKWTQVRPKDFFP